LVDSYWWIALVREGVAPNYSGADVSPWRNGAPVPHSRCSLEHDPEKWKPVF